MKKRDNEKLLKPLPLKKETEILINKRKNESLFIRSRLFGDLKET